MSDVPVSLNNISINDVSWVGNTPTSPVRFVSVRSSHTLPFDFNPVDATGTQEIGV